MANSTEKVIQRIRETKLLLYKLKLQENDKERRGHIKWVICQYDVI
jgi:hypothetical protein